MIRDPEAPVSIQLTDDEELNRPGLILKLGTAPYFTKQAAITDVPRCVALQDTYDVYGVAKTGSIEVPAAFSGDVPLAVEAATYATGDIIYLAETDGHGVNTDGGSAKVIGVNIERASKTISSADVTNKVNHIMVRLRDLDAT